MSKDCFHRTGRKLLSKIGKFILIVIIGYVTWVAVVSKHNAPQAERLYRTGKDLMRRKRIRLQLILFCTMTVLTCM